MLGDLFTLHGTLFKRMREQILKLPANINAVVYRSVLENQIILK